LLQDGTDTVPPNEESEAYEAYVLPNTDVGAWFTPDTVLPAAFTWNPNGSITLDTSSLIATALSAGASVLGTLSLSAGRYYFEITIDTLGSGSLTSVGLRVAASTSEVHVNVAGTVKVGSTTSSVSLGAIAAGDVIGIAVDLDYSLIWFQVQSGGTWGDWNASATADPVQRVGGIYFGTIAPAGTAMFPCADFSDANDQVTANFGATAFAGTSPSGYAQGWLTYKRRFTGLTAPTLTYTAAEMSADGFTPATDTLCLVVYQLSAVVGRGFPGFQALPAF
jgi:hypothetical protein